MVKSEILGGGALVRHYSDQPGMALLQTDTGYIYGEAVDVNPTDHVYEETVDPRTEVDDEDEIP